MELISHPRRGDGHRPVRLCVLQHVGKQIVKNPPQVLHIHLNETAFRQALSLHLIIPLQKVCRLLSKHLLQQGPGVQGLQMQGGRWFAKHQEVGKSSLVRVRSFSAFWRHTLRYSCRWEGGQVVVFP